MLASSAKSSMGDSKGSFISVLNDLGAFTSTYYTGDLTYFALSNDIYMAMTNFHIRNHSLKRADSIYYSRILANYQRQGRQKAILQRQRYSTRRAVKRARIEYIKIQIL